MARDKLKVGILGATGAVGQRFIQLLADHTWFEVSEVAGSRQSAGKRYSEAVNWKLDSPLPTRVRELVIKDLVPELDCHFVLSSLDAAVAGPVEEDFARAGYPVLSNSRNHRLDDDVPLVIPEVNPEHIEIISVQKKRRGFTDGFIATNPNCAAVGLALALKPLKDAFGIAEVFVVTMQAISGAGYPGVPAWDALGNVIPHIEDEEEKLEAEPLKILGGLQGEQFVPARIKISAQCNRVPVVDGHLESVSVRLNKKATVEEIKEALRSFEGEPQRLNLPSAPQHPIIVRDEPNRPQPRLDRNAENAMAVVVGRIRPCPILDFKLTLLAHNTVRGAAGAAILNAELLVNKGYLVRKTRLAGSEQTLPLGGKA